MRHLTVTLHIYIEICTAATEDLSSFDVSEKGMLLTRETRLPSNIRSRSSQRGVLCVLHVKADSYTLCIYENI